MKRTTIVTLTLSMILCGVSLPQSQAASLLAPGDPILAIDLDPDSQSNTPISGNEDPDRAIDGTGGTKYLNKGRENSGFIITPSSSSVVQSFQMTTANDHAGRDPSQFAIYGTNEAVRSGNNSFGGNENWTLIDSGAISLPAARSTLGSAVDITNGTSYSSYRVVFPENVGPDGGSIDSIQYDEIQFYTGSGATGSSIFGSSDSILAIDLDTNGGSESSIPGAGEAADKLIDGSSGSKYLNFGRINTGIIVTPSVGLSIVESFVLTTANDHDERDPSAWALYGTNDAIVSTDQSQGNGESWALIDSGSVSLPSGRNTVGPTVAVSNTTAYTSYRMVFTDIKGYDANSMQIAELQFDGQLVPEPSTIVLALLGLAFVGIRRMRKK